MFLKWKVYFVDIVNLEGLVCHVTDYLGVVNIISFMQITKWSYVSFSCRLSIKWN